MGDLLVTHWAALLAAALFGALVFGLVGYRWGYEHGVEYGEWRGRDSAQWEALIAKLVERSGDGPQTLE